MEQKRYAIGLDYGTNSVRAVIVDISDGKEVARYVHNYQKGKDGIILDAKDHNVARQHPADYVEGLEVCFKKVLNTAKKNRRFKPANGPMIINDKAAILTPSRSSSLYLISFTLIP